MVRALPDRTKLGDFSLDRICDPLCEAFISTGLWPPTELNAVPLLNRQAATSRIRGAPPVSRSFAGRSAPPATQSGQGSSRVSPGWSAPLRR
jgi:hypothetical protein